MYTSRIAPARSPLGIATHVPDVRGEDDATIWSVALQGKERLFGVVVTHGKSRRDFDFMFADQDADVRCMAIKDFDPDEYGRTFLNLSHDLRAAVIGWTQADADRHFSPRIGRSFSARLEFCEEQLRQHAESRAVASTPALKLACALNMLPTVSGRFLSLAQYESSYPHTRPWTHAIQVGDVLSCHHHFLNGTFSLDYARLRLGQITDANPGTTDITMVYRIQTTTPLSSAVPLIPGISAAQDFPDGGRVIFPRQSCFRVDGLAFAQELDEHRGARRIPVRRVGVQLTQVFPPIEDVKDLFTGERIS